MARKVLLVLAVVVLLLSAAFWLISAQEEEAHPIVTTASSVVGIDSYVAAQAFAVLDTHDVPVHALIIPYGIHPNMHLLDVAEFEQPAPLVEGVEFAWAIDGAEFLVEGNVVIFKPEAAGQYTVTLTATNTNGVSDEDTWVVTASEYVGVGIWGEELEHIECYNCHEDKTMAWLETGHSDMLIRGLEGALGDHYGEGCISCHTTGFGMGENGGFDDLALAAGWQFPETLEAGQWDAFVAEYPEVAELANIQCESCHGPGLAHATEGVRDNRMISTDLGYGVCAQCHAEDPYHVFPQQWENSKHGDIASAGFTYPVGEGEESCVRCHSGVGFIDTVMGREEIRLDYQPITCAVCHDPHDVGNPNQLRVFDTVVMPDGTEIMDGGPAATCMSCHNARRDGGGPGQVAAALDSGRISTPHHNNNQAELLTVGGGYTFGQELPSSPHGEVVEDSCVGCHMAASPGNDADGNPLPGKNEVGEHSFSMVSADGVENVGACQDCHVDTTTFEFEASRDYDGDGAVETIQEEVAGLHEALGQALLDAGLTDIDGRGTTFPENPTEAMFGGLWNYQFTAMNGTAVHNFRYAVALLQLSIQQLGGETGAPLPAR